MSLDYGLGGAKKKGRNLKKVVIAEVEPTPDGSKCPFHFGIRTYFHNIVEPQEKEVIETVDYLEEADYGEREKKGCSWEKGCKWCGVPLLFIGAAAILVGQLSPTREVIYRRGADTYLDRKAIAYNDRLQICALAGLAAFCTAALMILISFLIDAYSCPPAHTPTGHGYCPVLCTTEGGGIPLSGVLTTVQPPSTPVHSRR